VPDRLRHTPFINRHIALPLASGDVVVTGESTRPIGRSYRWIVLAIMSFLSFATYYIYDSITPLGTMIKQELGFSGSDYGLLFSAYSAANVFLLMVIVAGILVDKLGLKISGIFYGFLCLLGAAVTAVGASSSLPQWLGPAYDGLAGAFPSGWSPELKVMLLGRTLYGIGAEAILIVNNKVLARWFLGKELAFAYGLNLTIMRLGTFLALNLQAPAANAWGMIPALWLAVFVMGVGCASYFFYIWMEQSARGRPGAPQAVAVDTRATDETFRWKDTFSFDASFWLITALCVTFYSAIFPFQAYAPDILVQKFGYSTTLAGTYTSMLILGTMIFTPIFGWFVDRFGKRATMMMWGSLVLIPCHLLLGLTHFPPYILMFVVGISLSLVPAALWAAIPMMVRENRLGTAFGVIGWVQNIGLMTFPYVAGKIADAYTTVEIVGGEEVTRTDYTMTMVMFSALGVVGFLFAIALKRVDARRTQGPSIEAVFHR
jgi:MFS family permease